MKKTTLPIILCSLLSLGWLEQAAAAEKKDDTPPGKEFIYKHTKGKPQALEVYFPKGHDPATAKVPFVLLFHGGGWGGVDLSSFRYACQYFASRGLVAATANYYMIPRKERDALPAGTSRKSVCITDAKSAIRWMKQHAGDLGIDSQRIIVGGGSAGGHISILATTNPGLNDPADPKDFDTGVTAYLLFNPALSADDAEYPEVDALKYLKADFPPAIVFFGTEDKWKSGWDKAHDYLKALGADNRIHVWLAEGESHAFFNHQPWKDLTIIESDRFLVSLGLLKDEPILKPATESSGLTKEKQ